MKMTQGEKMIWAATFSDEYRRRMKNTPHDVGLDNWEPWENDQSSSVRMMSATAAVCAWNVVSKLRETYDRIADKHGDDHEVTLMMRQMVDDDKKK
jgi:hypothetical protein